ncbi:MAG: carbamoyltransferase HypF [Candidatus Cloacimonetes bacterium]|nr:carbamoyltransferase HypF [Candidatus Cloacimonadota bacterium]
MLSIKINGIVQGVGFRPFIYKLAVEEDLKGFVLNSTNGVFIEAEGLKDSLSNFIKRIKSELPPAAEIKHFEVEEVQDKNCNKFEIKSSSKTDGSTLISPDLAVCKDCIREFNDPNDPRYQYAFINCTNCGPRFSIIAETPYDRPVTSMKHFEMCEYCKGEYIDPLNRRFHAQPVACPECGPQLTFLEKNLKQVESDPIENTISALKDGKIVGIKGIGGFHIACDATNPSAVTELRKRKSRPHKPFAVMCLEKRIDELVKINDEQLKLLKSPASPILVLPKHSNEGVLEREIIAGNVAPQNPNIGVFLPYAPHHYQIINEELPFMIMTSGNLHDEPIAKEEKYLQELCDCFLTHNRPILNRSDDSVIRASKSQNIMIRRSRGFVPSPMKLPFKTKQTLGAGAELKITLALSKVDSLFLSPYIGNNNSKETLDFYLDTFHKYKKWFKLEPELVACDLHPDFMTTRFAESLGLPLVKVQHHHAHIAAIMAEHHLDEPVIGISYDGTGLGTDGKIWGGEILLVNYKNFERLFHLEYLPLPGGDAAIRHPIRIAFAYLSKFGIDTSFLENISDLEKKVIQKQLQNNFNVFQTSSMGRLFDCVAAILGLYPEISFEAQSAMALEFLCQSKPVFEDKSYSYNIDNHIIHTKNLLAEIAKDISNQIPKEVIARKFHQTILLFTLDCVNKAKAKTGVNKVVLAGGVMQNKVILEGLKIILQKQGFEVFLPSQLTPNDGSISVGQVLIANRNL